MDSFDEPLPVGEEPPLVVDPWRSADMINLALTFPDDGQLPHNLIRELGHSKMCQFEDMHLVPNKMGKKSSSTPASARRYREQVTCASECQRMLKLLQNEVNEMWQQEEIAMPGHGTLSIDFERDEYPVPGPDSDWAHFEGEEQPRAQNIANAHEKLKAWVATVNADNATLAQLTDSLNKLMEHMHVLQLAGQLMERTMQAYGMQGEVAMEMNNMAPEMPGESASNFITGSIELDKLETLRAKLHTQLRGNFVMPSLEIPIPIMNPQTGASVTKVVFAIYCPGKELAPRARRFVKAFGGSEFELGAPEQRSLAVADLGDQIHSARQTFEKAMYDKYSKLQQFYQHAKTLRKFITEEKLIYYTLNKCLDTPEAGFDLKFRAVTRLRASMWVPVAAMDRVKAAVAKANENGKNMVLMDEAPARPHVMPPTFCPTNSFTQGFQAIVDGYGIPDYKEINPTLFASAMFPFLFGVMFGDIVHGLLMLFFGLTMILKEKQIEAIPERNEIFEYMFSGRYTLFMMGICATYMGFIYNEALSLSLDLWGSSYAYSYVCAASVGGPMDFPDFGGDRAAATAEAGLTQFSAQGCTTDTLKEASSCWKYLGEERFYQQLPCGVNPMYPCSDEIVAQVNKCFDEDNQVETVTISMKPLVVPSGGEPRAFLPGSIGQPFEGSAMNSTISAENAAFPSYTAYKFGIDPVWRYSGTAIQFTNSLKMKISVILGVAQMTFGILLKWLNTIHFGKTGEFFAVCIPELLFMTATFGYMNYLIFLKWSTDYTQGAAGAGVPCFDTCPTFDADAYEGGCFREPPMIITTLIGMFMAGGTVGQDNNSLPDRCRSFLFESQESVQFVLLLVAMICVPWLFVVEPVLVYRHHKAKLAAKSGPGFHPVSQEELLLSADLPGEGVPAAEPVKDEEEDDEEDDFSMGDVIVGQSIHAIEFILGCVSNTASYLRLWALSLAHSQLSEVFMEYIFKGYEIELLGGQYPGIASQSVSMIVICFAVFFACNIAVLMVMESLSAFLHALRLQWVEFQNKFYHATGYKFSPLNFEDREQLVASDSV